MGNADLTRPVIGQEGLWILPQLAPGSGDRGLAGGSGVGWSDRLDIAISLDAPLRDAGFDRAEPMKRLAGVLPVAGPFANTSGEDSEKRQAQRRAALLKTLGAIGNKDSMLDVLIFCILEATPTAAVQELREYLGAPDREDGLVLSWADGLKIRMVQVASGPLAESFPKADLAEHEKAGKTDRQQAEIRRTKQAEANTTVAARMRDHVRTVRDGRSAIACALLEMPGSLRNRAAEDPYAIARSELASQRVLPQVMLVETNGAKAATSKLRAALRDMFRMLGVLPVFQEQLVYAPAAIATVQRNSKIVGGGSIQAHAFPLALRTRDGVLECAIPEESGEPRWMPCAEAALFIFSGVYGRFGRSRQEDNVAKFHAFFGAAIEQIDRQGPSLILADMESLSDKWLSTIQNGRLRFDRLEIANRVFTPKDLGNLRIVRVCVASEKVPSYYHGQDTQWPSGLFAWGDGSRRTPYALKKKPNSAKYVSAASLVSRHLDPADNRSIDSEPRRLPSLDEMSVIFCKKGDDIEALKLFAHRLRHVHVQYDDDTSLPFPLHELRLLGRAVTS